MMLAVPVIVMIVSMVAVIVGVMMRVLMRMLFFTVDVFVRVIMAVLKMNIELGSCDRSSLLLRDVQMKFIQSELLQFRSQRVRINADVNHCANEHVTADAAEDVEVKYFHGSLMEP